MRRLFPGFGIFYPRNIFENVKMKEPENLDLGFSQRILQKSANFLLLVSNQNHG